MYLPVRHLRPRSGHLNRLLNSLRASLSVSDGTHQVNVTDAVSGKIVLPVLQG